MYLLATSAAAAISYSKAGALFGWAGRMFPLCVDDKASIFMFF